MGRVNRGYVHASMRARRLCARVVEQTAAAYKQIQQRSLSKSSLVALMIDGKTFQREQIIMALGLDLYGVGHVLDMIQASF